VERSWTIVTRILVVDDETALVELVRSYLEREQYEVLTAADGRTALDLARAAQPDLVVLDVMLPMCWLLSISVLKRALMLALPVLFLCYLLIREMT